MKLIKCTVMKLMAFCLLAETMWAKKTEDCELNESKTVKFEQWQETWEQIDKNGTEKVIWEEFWDWITRCLLQKGFSEFTISKYKVKFYKQYYEIAGEEYGFDLDMVKCYIKKKYP